ncbi:hypothetical protein CEXT_483361 [Caerostris extrusa]|uniref:Uncharacterized protein n=1 Tax=Caerostris extrusa TaxID=172846 RepID=A0AAV4Q530_CAEEX|nr:hypothetical protein CEXT_483361 [Caerostris extrusa]
MSSKPQGGRGFTGPRRGGANLREYPEMGERGFGGPRYMYNSGSGGANLSGYRELFERGFAGYPYMYNSGTGGANMLGYHEMFERGFAGYPYMYNSGTGGANMLGYHEMFERGFAGYPYMYNSGTGGANMLGYHEMFEREFGRPRFLYNSGRGGPNLLSYPEMYERGFAGYPYMYNSGRGGSNLLRYPQLFEREFGRPRFLYNSGRGGADLLSYPEMHYPAYIPPTAERGYAEPHIKYNSGRRAKNLVDVPRKPNRESSSASDDKINEEVNTDRPTYSPNRESSSASDDQINEEVSTDRPTYSAEEGLAKSLALLQKLEASGRFGGIPGWPNRGYAHPGDICVDENAESVNIGEPTNYAQGKCAETPAKSSILNFDLEKDYEGITGWPNRESSSASDDQINEEVSTDRPTYSPNRESSSASDDQINEEVSTDRPTYSAEEGLAKSLALLQKLEASGRFGGIPGWGYAHPGDICVDENAESVNIGEPTNYAQGKCAETPAKSSILNFDLEKDYEGITGWPNRESSSASDDQINEEVSTDRPTYSAEEGLAKSLALLQKLEASGRFGGIPGWDQNENFLYDQNQRVELSL